MNDKPGRRAGDWVDRTYGGLVTLAGKEPLVEGERTLLFGCDYAGGSTEPLLAATIAVPRDGGEPFPVANSDPLDEEFNATGPENPGAQPWRWRVNARGCVVATDAAVDQYPASALPWHPLDEAPGWWDRLLAGRFPGAEVATCSTWDDLSGAILEGGPGTRGVVWLRRQLNGAEVTGHLLYALYHDDNVVVLDGQRGSLARLDDQEIGQLTLARFHRARREDAESVTPPWEIAAPDLASAIHKASGWLDWTYQGKATLVQPDADDEIERGWLFACTTKRFQVTGDWRDQMLDAALVVPKAAGEVPFGLPNDDPWTWLHDWDERVDGLPEPPAAASADWFEPTTRELGPIVSESAHSHWGGALREIATFPIDTKVLVWVRRRDGRGRETVGNLLVATHGSDGVRFVDSMAAGGWPAFEDDLLGLHVFRFR
ncbi:YrhB domain-containing protein [Saccharopolyspora sp. 5N708]|uniref:YrhB domain-containing protein n=1 Tax=Saccharopolyspora sp. 5N708 TaxID=3457424 RepID=UPI003FCFB563